VLLVDDHPVVREGYRRLLENTPDIRVAAEAGDGESAIVFYEKYPPDVVILDLSMPGIGGLETLRRIKAKDAAARILVFSMHDSEIMMMRSLKAGATGYLTKNNGAGQMAEAVRSVAQGKTFVDSAHFTNIISQQLFGTVEDPLLALSQREFQIFQLLAEGLSVNDIAASLSISPKTVGVHHASIMKKLELHNPTQLVRLAIRCNVIKP
jgi:two-component system invasion response regulator UvrY